MPLTLTFRGLVPEGKSWRIPVSLWLGEASILRRYCTTYSRGSVYNWIECLKDRLAKVSQSEVDIPLLPSTDVAPEQHCFTVMLTVSAGPATKQIVACAHARNVSGSYSTIPKSGVRRMKELGFHRVFLRVPVHFY